MGPAGPAGSDGQGVTVVDANGVVIGTLLDGYNGWVVRQEGDDRLLLQATALGVPASPITFLHTTDDCSGPRYVSNMNGVGLLFFAQWSGSQLVYSRLIDPSFSVALVARSIEAMDPGQDLSTPGLCIPQFSTAEQSMGLAVIANVPTLGGAVAPLRVQ